MMKSWVLWMIHHKMAWLVKLLAIMSYPLTLVIGYYDEAWDDIEFVLDEIDRESRK